LINNAQEQKSPSQEISISEPLSELDIVANGIKYNSGEVLSEPLKGLLLDEEARENHLCELRLETISKLPSESPADNNIYHNHLES